MNRFAIEVRDLVIRPVIARMGGRLDSEAAVQLVALTFATESDFERLRQVARFDAGGEAIRGPARGFGQMEPPTLDWTVGRIHADPMLSLAVRPFLPRYPTEPDALVWSTGWAVAVCRARYWLDPQPLPDPADFHGLYAYYKRVWNTELGAATARHVWDMCWACFGTEAPYLREGTRP